MARPVTSFQKKPRGGKRIEIPGTKPSIHNNQLLISTGIPSVDFNVGGGVAVGTLILIEEDVVGSFANLMLRYFIAEGVTSGHSLFLAAKEPHAILKQIPTVILHDGGDGVSQSTTTTTTKPSDRRETGGDDELKIAWRYKDANKPDGTGIAGDNKFGHYYDLNSNIEASTLDEINKKVVDLSEARSEDLSAVSPRGMAGEYGRVLHECATFLERGQNFVSSTLKPEERNILRIAIHSAGSPLWDSSDPFSLPKFFFCLKNLLRQSFACALVTVPSEILSVDSKVVAGLRHLADYAIKLKSFAGTDDAENPALKDYHGLFHIVKLPRLNSLTRFTPSTFDLAFKLRRKRFTVEKLHLPPDLAETAEREQDETTLPKAAKSKKKAAAGIGGGCGSGGGGLDF